MHAAQHSPASEPLPGGTPRLLEMALHSQRVAQAAREVAVLLDVAEDEASRIEVAARLHQIGKIGMPDDLLAKDLEEMTSLERAAFERHPALAQAALRSIPALDPVGFMIRHHTERVDGRGFPDGLAGGQIPLGARIIAVCDGFYRECAKGHAAETALRTLDQQTGRRFDTQVVAAFSDYWRAHEAAALDGIQRLHEVDLTLDEMLAYVDAREKKDARETLPAPSKPLPSAEAPTLPVPAEAPTLPVARKAHILLIDRDVRTRQALVGTLEAAGYQVVSVASAREALEQRRRFHFDAAVLDLDLPDLDGFQLCQKLTNPVDSPPIPVMIYTARRHRDDVLKAVRYGAREYLVKPARSDPNPDQGEVTKKLAHLFELHEELASLATIDIRVV